ncbi:hypothetical protein [Bradyrhizobium manausense]|uniref:Uncharacterized protein n=1 Tax=Bradyrhizobium manausense TaxID=989370 RepID=A0A0R3D0C9_9BRAD|nr:hypothetical protein [Bradyrhizobium manausense]KRQ03291.1 hypothetical protein AOQ71_31685 [Bradyrhizobium manausense]
MQQVAAQLDKLHILAAHSLLQQRDALARGDTKAAAAHRKNADAALKVAKAAAKKYFPGEVGEAMDRQLTMLDARHRRLVKATGKTGLLDVVNAGGDRGKEAKAAFEALAYNDPLARRVLNANTNAIAEGRHHKSKGAKDKLAKALPAYDGNLSPKAAQQILRRYIAVRGSGRPVMMQDFLAGHGVRKTAGPQDIASQFGIQG